MSTSETFYRVHWRGTEFSADNAWSVPWGAERSADGTKTRCTDCDGVGSIDGEPCRTCDEGWEDAIRGYSCVHTADELVAYFGSHGAPAEDEMVVIFDGMQVGTGVDGEPLAIPTCVKAQMTWAAFAQWVNTHGQS